MTFSRINAVVLLVLGACSQSNNSGELPAPGEQAVAAPWQAATVSPSDVPQVYTQVWQQAANRNSCALIALTEHGQSKAFPRSATFSGGWAVAYDLPTQRSAFGIAGAGVNAADPSYNEWPHRRSWSDGSNVGYGPEGGTGPNQLAYLRIAGQGCLYNVWSRLGTEHLESLLQGIRFVR